MTYEEAEHIMKPFYPHDPKLAVQALVTALTKEVLMPEWMLEPLVHSFFTFLSLEDMTERIPTDLFGWKTVPYYIRGYRPNSN